MSDDKERKVKGYLYSEIARLKQHISEMYDEHRIELKTWTWKCGKMGNDIGNLRKQLAEKNDVEAVWTHKYDRLQKMLSEKETELQEGFEDLEKVQWEYMKLKQRLEKKELDFDKIQKEVDALRLLMQEKEQEMEHHTEVVQVEIHAEPRNTSITNEIVDLTSAVADITVENEIEHRNCGQLNEMEADSIVKTYCSSESEVDGEKKVSEPVDTNELGEDAQENLPVHIAEQVQHYEDAKQKAKYHFWSTLKKRVSIKGKRVKPTPLRSKVNEGN
ncbi:hypothetical protein HA402_008607 [Bradysia odoriphaga]|nr:hypothetical protein HA402_008607 [Bradysia odoriphaga]